MTSSHTGQPSIEVFDILIMEPIVTLTDLLVTLVSFYAFYKLNKQNRPGRSHKYLRFYFLIMGIATAFGGITGHAFQYALGIEWKLPGWLLSMVAISAFERGIISFLSPIIPKRISMFLEVTNIVELIVFSVISFVTLNFFFVQVHSVYGLAIVVFPLCFYAFWKTGNKGARIICLAVLFSILAAVVYTNQISISIWFNHLDLSHTIMAVTIYFIYKGADEIGELSKIKIRTKELTFTQAWKSLFTGI